MKKKIKKLFVNKITISNLRESEMEKQLGGKKTNGNGNTCARCTISNWCTYQCTHTICGGTVCTQ